MSKLFYSESDTAKTVRDLISKKLLNTAREVAFAGLQCHPDSMQLRDLNAQIATKLGDFNTATASYEHMLELGETKPELLLQLAQAWNHAGEADTALGYAQQYIDTSKDSSNGQFAKCDIYERNGRIDEAKEILDGLRDDEHDELRWKYLMIRLLLSSKQYEAAVDFILKHRTEFEESPESQDVSMASFSLCKAYDRLGEYDKAWAAAEHAHALNDDYFDEEKYFANYAEIENFFTRDIVDALVSGPETDFDPLFIVGNPRSGTSLLEQIMSMHPGIVNGGEMSVGIVMQIELARMTDSFHKWPMNMLDMTQKDAQELSKQYAEAVDLFRTDEKVVTNKSLALPAQLGFFSKVMPRSKAVMLYRNPLDNAVSCYTTNLISSGHLYTKSLDTLGKTIKARKRLTDCWLERLSIPMMELHYESLVSNQREETGRLIKFLDLPWEEDCMEFHKSSYVARTISYDQVNQKMYTSSTNRWKNYEKHLGPLLDMFE